MLFIFHNPDDRGNIAQQWARNYTWVQVPELDPWDSLSSLIAVEVTSVIEEAVFLVTDSKFHRLPTLSSHNSCSKPLNHLILYIFGILRTSAFTRCYPGYVFQHQNLK